MTNIGFGEALVCFFIVCIFLVMICRFIGFIIDIVKDIISERKFEAERKKELTINRDTLLSTLDYVVYRLRDCFDDDSYFDDKFEHLIVNEIMNEFKLGEVLTYADLYRRQTDVINTLIFNINRINYEKSGEKARLDRINKIIDEMLVAK